MRDIDLGRIVRALRRRRGWRQIDCSTRAGVHRSTWSSIERGHFDRLSLLILRRCLAVLDVKLDLLPSWRGAQLSRLMDEGHAALQAEWKRRLEAMGWLVRVEVSFNHYGDRGRIDLVAWHPRLQILVIAEVKTEIADAQGLLGALDVKVRVAPNVAKALGLGRPRLILPLLIVADGSTNRDRIARLQPLFARFTIRGRQAAAWLRNPRESVVGLLVFTDLRNANGGSVTQVTPHRIRPTRRDLSVEKGSEGAAAAS
ncbi:MAG TPA: helix-turn-helix domain-containing protein [Candidatus Limnocylindria bacterium]|nr:helix-turn-helix domain-containing protein [Candidatus Limnocylindria bacterium]